MFKLSAGSMVERVVFQRRLQVDDQAGNTEGDWDAATQIRRPAGFIMRPGSEAVLAERLEGRQPVTAFTYYDSETCRIEAGVYRMIDENDGTVYAILAAADMDRKRQWMTFVCRSGVQA